MKGSDLLVAALENEGVERIFGLPGEENLDVVESLPQALGRPVSNSLRESSLLLGKAAVGLWARSRRQRRLSCFARNGSASGFQPTII